MRAVVVGAGMGGLCAAVRLAALGIDTTLVERDARVGGKIRTIDVDGSAIPAGPTVLTMPWVFEELFADTGGKLSDVLTLTPLNPIARHVFADGRVLDLGGDIESDSAAIGDFAGAKEARGYRAFRKYAARMFDAVRDRFMTRSVPSWTEFLSFQGLRDLGTLGDIDARRTMWRALEEFFGDARLQALFGRYATYVGSSPFEAPATLNVIAHVELAFGVHTVASGLERLATVIHDRFTTLGGKTLLSRSVTAVNTRSRRVVGLTCSDGTELPADVVFWNGEPTMLDRALDGQMAPARPRPDDHDATKRSLSALLLLTRVPRHSIALPHHTVVFGAHYPTEHEDLFGRRTMPSDPTVYVCAPDRVGTTAPAGEERLMALVNAPAGTTVEGLEEERCRSRIHATLNRAGLDLSKASAELMVRPQDFASRFPGSMGALYGPALRSVWAPLKRAGARHPQVSGLYRIGGAVHPGAGLPMVALSAKIAIARMLADQSRGPSKPFLRLADMVGGTSTS